jgi:hypothetical protein
VVEFIDQDTKGVKYTSYQINFSRRGGSNNLTNSIESYAGKGLPHMARYFK